MESRAPRNIRDIAHLYISRPHRGPRRVAVSATDREAFPGLHVANLALALALDGHRVRVVERSGLLMNAACFLALPPQVYAAAPPRRPAGGVTAAGGVEVVFGDAPPAPAPRADASSVVELVHLPPLDRDGGRDALTGAGEAPDVVVIARDPGGVRALDVVGRRLWLLLVGGVVATGATFAVAGRIDRWERTLADPVPAVLRDPDSTLSRRYREATRRILTRPLERNDHADRRPSDDPIRRLRSAPPGR